MALFNSISLGSARQKIGNVVLYRSKGQSIARQLNPAPLNPKTTAQVAQRSALSNAVKAWKATFGYFSVLQSMITSRLSAYNTFVSAVIPVAQVAGPTVWDYHDAVLAIATKNDADGDFIGSNELMIIDSVKPSLTEVGAIEVEITPLIYPLPDHDVKARAIAYDDEGALLSVAYEHTFTATELMTRKLTIIMNDGSYDFAGKDFIVAVGVYDEVIGKSTALHFESVHDSE